MTTTTTQRQATRRAKLDEAARKLGISSWAMLETLVLHGLIVTVEREYETRPANSDKCHYAQGKK